MRSWVEYSGLARNAIHSLKYKNNIALGYFFSKKLCHIIEHAAWDFDLVIPVPLSSKHFRERGFNQSALIARPLAHLLRKKYAGRILYRIRETKSQVNLTAEERHVNVKGAFWGNPAKLNGRTVLLVDDVITTGATMENCVTALLASGAKKVYCISVARVIVNHPI
jgi:ComF family protein